MSPAPLRRLARPLVTALLVGGCGAPAPTSNPGVVPAGDAVDAVDAGDAAGDRPATPPATAACSTAACEREAADAARAAGAFDLASAALGRAFALEPDAAGLRAWIDALVAGGQRRAAHRVLAELAAGDRGPALRSTIDALARDLPPAGADRSLAIDGAIPAILREALAAHARGDLEAARRSYEAALAAGAIGPRHLVGFAALLDALGDPAAARRVRSRARIDLEERGASFELIPSERWFTAGVFWLGDQIVQTRLTKAVDYGEARRAEILSLWPAGASERPIRELFFADPAAVTVASADGRLLLRGVGRTLEVIDPESGARLRTITARGGDIRQIASAGAGERLHVLVAAGHQGELWRIDGEHLGDFPLTGTTPTITRVYRAGHGTEHDNILEDSPTWPVSLALTDDAGALAIGGSDSKVRLFTRGRGGAQGRLLAYAWSYEERRPMGGNPDLNMPLALRFVDGGAALLVAYAHGDLIRWRVRDGAREKHHPAACSEAEVARMLRRDSLAAGEGEPRRRPTAAEREDCGRSQHALIAGDGRFVLTTSRGGAGIRVRDGRSGAPRFQEPDFDVPRDLLAVSAAGRVALSILYGHLVTWSEADGLAWHHRGPADTGPITPSVGDSGRVLTFDLDGGDRRWDLFAGRSLDAGLAAGERLIAVADDGVTAVIRRGPHLELRRAAAPPRLLETLDEAETAAAIFSSRGDRLVLDLDDPRRPGGRRVLAHDLRTATKATIPIAVGHLLVSADGEAITTTTAARAIEVYRARDGHLLATIDQPAAALALAPDASFVAWIAPAESPMTVARVAMLGAGAPTRPVELRVPGWPRGLAVAPDAQELLVITEGSITRWRGREGKAAPEGERAAVIANRVHYSADGRHLFFERYDRVDVHQNLPGVPLLASIVPLLSGGYLIQSATGEVDGTPDAPSAALTWVTPAVGEPMAASGELAWDRLHADGLYRRLLVR